MVFLLVLQAFIALALIGVILLQKSEGGGLGLGGGGGNSGNVFTARGAANFLTRLTAILAALFMLNCLVMSVVAGRQINKQASFLDAPANSQQVPAPAEPKKILIYRGVGC